MAMWRRAMVYLGLVDEPDDDVDGIAAASHAPDPGPNIRPLSRDEAPAAAARPSVVRTMPSASTAARVHVLQPGTAMASIASILYQLTEPVLGPVRRLIPSIGMIDISPIIVFFGLQILQSSVFHCGAL